ncbi:MAG TPA: nucleotidyltransferase domain-containing protein [Phycisphaerae bacterium]|nr:nucleotidyltransferase domain-containing protein [Phycisphaerae bacterium]
MTDIPNARLSAVASEQPHPLLFVTVSGAHLYGFPSADSDYDLRGAHVLPAEAFLGLDPPEETVEVSHKPAAPGDIELDLVTHDVRKFMRLMLKKNGYVLEQLYSPLVVHTTPEHEELKALGRLCITRHHVHHYLGFARTQWDLFRKEDPPRVKPLLYVYRVLLTGIHLMQSGEVEANLLRLNETFRLPQIADLVARKVEGGERGCLAAADLEFYEREYERLTAELERAGQESHLPEQPSARGAMNDLLLRIRRHTYE